MQTEWKRRLTIIGIAVGVFAGYKYLLPAVIPFLAAWMLAVWIYPVTVKVEKRTRIKKGITGTLILLGLLLLLGGIGFWAFSELLSQMKTALFHFPKIMARFPVLVDRCCLLLEKSTGILRATSKNFIMQQMSAAKNSMQETIGADAAIVFISWTKNVLFLISGIVVTVISAVLIIGDMEKIRRKIWDYTWLVGTRRVARRLQRTTVTYLKAQLIIMILVGIVCGAGLWLIDNPYFLLLGAGLGIMDAIPLIGTGTFLYPAAVILLIKGRQGAAVICILLDIVTSFLREFLEPKLLGGGLGVSPVVVLAAVYLGILLFGAGELSWDRLRLVQHMK